MKIAIIGYGKMGKAIEDIALTRGHQVALRINSANPKDLNTLNLSTVDVAIEFTTPENTVNNMLTCFKEKVPVVVGTTAWYDKFEYVENKCLQLNGTLLYATNCSIGVNLFFKLNETLAQLMNNYADYNITVDETHHTEKKDTPSGTAITLANAIIKNIDRKTSWKNKNSKKSDELSILSHRITNVAGTHIVKYQSAIDEIEIKHTAHNRNGFALGAVIAAEYICNRKGIYTMNDVLFN